ncbi:MAG: DUF4142 domain-containing protein [Phycisphaeraceae bacterium]|nr:DUF4142 domain-containing protein [Phycisphaeraceae bacterium]
MQSNLRRSATTLFILTPAALLAACSSSDSWRSSRADTNARTDDGSNGTMRSDGYYTNSSQGSSSADSRTAQSSSRSVTDPYGDGVGAVKSINREFDLANNRANNPNWRDGPSRYDNQNPSHDSSSSRYNTGISRNQSPAEGTLNNQNIAKGTVVPAGSTTGTNWQNRQDDASMQQGQQNWQRGERSGTQNEQQNWANRNQNSDPNWNSNNQQLPPRQEDGNWANRNLDTTNMTTPEQQAAARHMSNPQTNPSNSNAQFNQNSSGQYNTAQNNGANRDSSVMSPTSSQQAAARDIADPATNPTNSNAQIGQQNTASGNQPYSTRSADLRGAGQPALVAANATADSRILSLVHMKNQEEISLGRLAASNGSSAAVKEYGNMLVLEHSAADAKVLAVASQTGTQLLSDTETMNMIRADRITAKDQAMDPAKDKDREKMADDSTVRKDPAEELRSLSGTDFDKAFSEKMVKGHQKLAAAIEKAQPQVRNEQTRQLLNELLPTIQKHEKLARQLPGFTETASVR